jgi:hypothetical protein
MFAYAEAGYYLKLPSCQTEVEAALAEALRQGRTTTAAECEMLLARLALRVGSLGEAQAHLARSYRIFLDAQDAGFLRYVYEVAVALKTAQGRFRNAAILAGLLARLHYQSGSYLQPARVHDHEKNLERCKIELGEENFQKAFDEGLDLPPQNVETLLVDLVESETSFGKL